MTGSESDSFAPGSLEQWANDQPNTPAFADDSGVLTYGVLAEAANRLASALADRGLRSGDHVAVRTRVRAEWFVVHRALGKLGCHQVCMSWRLTPPEATHVAVNSGVRHVVCDDPDPGPLTSCLTEAGAPRPITIAAQDQDETELSYESLLAAGTPEHRATPLLTSLVLYTSGTTGQPRGVHVDNRINSDQQAMLRYQGSLLSHPPVEPGERVLLTLPLHHGAGPLNAALAHAMGGTVYGLDPYDPEQALRMITEHGITHWSVVPTMLLRIRALPVDVFERYDLSSLHSVTVGAAAVPAALRTWFTESVGEILWENYGTSESGMVTYLDPQAHRHKPGSSGVPYDEVDIRIVDEDWQPLVPGETGEVAVRTPVVVGKYIGERQLGSDTLSADGFFRTGDIGYLDGDGHLFIVDRRKDLIVAGGVNIYPAEIEKALLHHPDVVDVAVVGVPEETFGEQPKAFIEHRPGASTTGEEIVDSTSDRLAKHKRPRIVEFVDELPRNPMGKIMKFVLRDAEWKDRERKI